MDNSYLQIEIYILSSQSDQYRNVMESIKHTPFTFTRNHFSLNVYSIKHNF